MYLDVHPDVSDTISISLNNRYIIHRPPSHERVREWTSVLHSTQCYQGSSLTNSPMTRWSMDDVSMNDPEYYQCVT